MNPVTFYTLRLALHATPAHVRHSFDSQPAVVLHGFTSIKAALDRHPDIAELISACGEREVEKVGMIEGVTVKTIIDGITPTTMLRRFVTSKEYPSASPESFATTVCKLDLDMQYTIDAHLVPGLLYRWIVSESTAPYVAACYHATAELYASGMEKLTRACRLVRECQKNDEWLGYSGVVGLSLPKWREIEMEETKH